MSEYQYYEWQTVDRPLTESEMGDVRRLSSHMEVVTSTQAVVTYSYGDFKHDPLDVLAQYFDAFLYLTNWGSHELAFRFPKGSFDVHSIRAYLLGDYISVSYRGPYTILDLSLDEEGVMEWVEGEGILGQLVALRDQIIQGDYRLLYLAWLGAASFGESSDGDVYADEDLEEENEVYDGDTDDEVSETLTKVEPPVPPGMGELTGALRKFIEVFGIDPHLVKAAAQSSPKIQPVADEAIVKNLPLLTREECEAYLLRVLRNEPQTRIALQKRLLELGGSVKTTPAQPQRSVGDLYQTANLLKQEEKQRKREEAEHKRIKELERLAENEEAAWRQVASLIEEKRAKPYDDATALLVRLRDLAVYQQRPQDF